MPIASPYPAVHSGGIKAVAMATPAMVFVCLLRLLMAIIKAKPPAMAINTSRTSGDVLAKSSGVSFLNIGIKKNRNEVNKLNPTITPKFINERLKVSISLIPIDNPTPKIGPNNGDISIAPITTAGELIFNPTEAIITEKINTQAVWPFM